MSSRRKTRIVATFGPASDSTDLQKQLLSAGVNVARFNFSHGSHEEQGSRIASLRAASREIGIPVAFMMDTKGPEIRTGKVRGGEEIDLKEGSRICLCSEQIEGDAERLSISYENLPNEVKSGDHIFIADGLVDLEVLSSSLGEISCLVRSGGRIGSRKNVNVPGVRVALPALTVKDRQDILFAVEQDLDFIAASFIRRAEDVEEIRNLLKEHSSAIRIIAKIENQEGLDNIDDIIRVSDGVMVARGDLGVQLAFEAIPLAQKRIIDKCMRAGKPVIIATQMLDSMIRNPNPSRAELTDVANAIFDGADAVMLSGETANGNFPVEAVQAMDRIAKAVESSPEYRKQRDTWYLGMKRRGDVGHAIAKSACSVAEDCGASAIVAPTLRGNTPRILSAYRPPQLVIAVTASKQSYRQLLLHWGIIPLLSEEVSESEMMIQNALRLAKEKGLVQVPDRVVTAAGIPLNSPQPINTIKVHFLGTILTRGQGGTGGRASGPVVCASNYEEALNRLKWDGSEILITRTVDEQYSAKLHQLKGMILEDRSIISPEEIAAAAPNLVFVTGVRGALESFEDGQFVTLDGGEQIVYEGFM